MSKWVRFIITRFNLPIFIDENVIFKIAVMIIATVHSQYKLKVNLFHCQFSVQWGVIMINDLYRYARQSMRLPLDDSVPLITNFPFYWYGSHTHTRDSHCKLETWSDRLRFRVGFLCPQDDVFKWIQAQGNMMVVDVLVLHRPSPSATNMMTSYRCLFRI